MDNLEILLNKMHTKKLYCCNDNELIKEQLNYLDIVFEYNNLKPSKQEEKKILIKKMFKTVGNDCYIEAPFRANFGGKNVTIGDNFYSNFNLTLVDDGEICIGNNVLIAPNVIICSAGHPISPILRKASFQYNIPVKIGNNVWIGANTTIMAGVTIGDNTVIGACSLVTKDIPSNVVAFGSPCNVVREINEMDKKYYYKDLKIDEELKNKYF